MQEVISAIGLPNWGSDNSNCVKEAYEGKVPALAASKITRDGCPSGSRDILARATKAYSITLELSLYTQPHWTRAGHQANW